MLVRTWCLLFTVMLLVMLFSRPLNTLVLLLIFAQPAVVLYLFYWRTRRQHVSLDVVVKLFSVGFFMSTTQAVFFESVLELLLGLAVAIVLPILTGGEAPPGGAAGTAGAAVHGLSRAFLQGMARAKSSLQGGLAAYALAAFQLALAPDAHASSDSFGAHGLSQGVAVTNGDEQQQQEQEEEEEQRALMRRFFPLVIAYCLVMAFVIAAGVEETMKHFAARCCRFTGAGEGAGIPRGSSPQAVLVCLLTAALGFATAENLEYVFGLQASVSGRGHGALALLLGELAVLALRLLMPVHLICAVLQAANLSQVLLDINIGLGIGVGVAASMSLPRLLLSAIALHGAFDFVLFLLGAVQAAYGLDDSPALLVCSFLLPALIVVVGLVCALRAYKQVEARYDSDWQPVRGDDIELQLVPPPPSQQHREQQHREQPAAAAAAMVVHNAILTPPVHLATTSVNRSAGK
jgi:RsiW-degrading membrane proteinase PrsW (M82 family)